MGRAVECAADGTLEFISVFGRIGYEDLDLFTAVDEALPEGAVFPRVLVNSPGGSVGIAMEIGSILRRRHAVVESGSPIVEDNNPQCSSACVVLAAGAEKRRLIHIGLHSAHVRVKTAPNEAQDEAVSSEVVDAYYRRMGISDRVAAISRVTPFEDMTNFFIDPSFPLEGQDIVEMGFFMPDVAPFDPSFGLPPPSLVETSNREYSELAYQVGAVTAAYDVAQSYTRYSPDRKPDFVASNLWLAKGAERGDLVAMHELAYHYAYGVGTEVDQDKAIELYKQAAALGFASSQNNLGWAYYTGHGTKQSLTDAIFWLTRSAEQGEPFAYGSLCEIQADTDFLQDNRAEAYKWCQLALRDMPEGSARGASEAAYAKLKPRLTEDDIKAGDRLVKAWQPLWQTRSTMTNVGDDLN